MSRETIVTSTFLALAAMAPQWAAAQPDGAGARATLEEVIVTAQRRQESLMSMPLSIQALSGDKLTDAGIGDLT